MTTLYQVDRSGAAIGTASTAQDVNQEAPPPGRKPWSAWLAVVVIAAAAAYGGHYLIQKRHQTATTMSLPSAVLGAQQIPVGVSDPATVASVHVAAGDVVRAGQTLAQLILSGSGSPNSSRVLVAPVDGVIVSIDHASGSVVKAGEPVVTEYASASLSFMAPVAVEQAQKLKIGMNVKVDGPGLATPIDARVGAAQASLDGRNPNVVSVALIPTRLDDVRELVPGLAFRAKVELTGYPAGSVSVLRGGR